MHCPRCGANIKDEDFVCIKCGYLENIAIIAQIKDNRPKPEEIVDNRSYAGFWKRCWAIILDYLILLLSVALIAGIIGGIIFVMSRIGKFKVHFQVIQDFAVGFGAVFAFALSWAYFTGFESSKFQATLGKKIMRILVIDKDGKRITLGRANARYWMKLISTAILFAGFWMAGFNKKKRTLHDLLTGTMVLNKIAAISENKPEI